MTNKSVITFLCVNKIYVCLCLSYKTEQYNKINMQYKSSFDLFIVAFRTGHIRLPETGFEYYCNKDVYLIGKIGGGTRISEINYFNNAIASERIQSDDIDHIGCDEVTLTAQGMLKLFTHYLDK